MKHLLSKRKHQNHRRLGMITPMMMMSRSMIIPIKMAVTITMKI